MVAATQPPSGSLLMLPAAPGTCQVCAVKHGPAEAHNCQSLFYRMRFKMEYGRDATWADAIAHCDPKIQAFWRDTLKGLGHWSEPEGEPIAEPCDHESPVVLQPNKKEPE